MSSSLLRSREFPSRGGGGGGEGSEYVSMLHVGQKILISRPCVFSFFFGSFYLHLFHLTFEFNFEKLF